MDPTIMFACKASTQAKRQAQEGLAITGAVAVMQCVHPLQSPCNMNQPLSCSLPASQCFVINQLVWSVYLILQPFRR